MLRDSVWPDADSVVFKAPSPGYCKVVPRIVPLVGAVANHVKVPKGDLSATYFDLWVRTDNDGFVEVQDEHDCAACAGYWKRKGAFTWRERIRELERLQLIRVYREPDSARVRYVLLLEPFEALERLKVHPSVPPTLKERIRQRVMFTTRQVHNVI